MALDWKALLQVAINRLITIILTAGATYLSTKWAAGAEVMRKLNAGDTVSLWAGTFTFSVVNLQTWAFLGAVAVISILIGWYNKVKLKRQANIALALPKAATKTDVAVVDQDSKIFSAEPNPSAVRQVAQGIAGP